MAKIIIIGLPLLWTFGAHVNDLARAILLLVGIFICIRTKQAFRGEVNLHRSLNQCLTFFLLCYGCYLIAEPWLSTYLGRQGDEFLVFTQVVDSIARRGTALTSVIEPGTQWANFLWHHFSPFLYVPSWLVLLGISPYGAISLVHGACGAIAGLFFYLSARHLFDRNLAIILTAIVAANPTIRHSLFLGVHDEVFALPFVGYAFWAWITGRPNLMLIGLLLAATTKESLSLVGIGFLLMVLLERTKFFGKCEPGLDIGKLQRPNWLPGSLVVGILLTLFIGYFFVQPQLVGKSFDHFSKLATYRDFLDYEQLSGKFQFILFLGLPTLLCPFFSRRSMHLVLPAAPLIGIILLSRFAEMWKPMNYYGVLPSYMLSFAAMISIAKSQRAQLILKKPILLVILMAVAFSFSGKKPFNTVVAATRNPWLSESDLAIVPSEARIVATPSSALLLLRTSFIWRLEVANRLQPDDFDMIVVKNSEVSNVSEGLKSKSKLCYSSSQWVIFCRIGSQFQL